jgi:predicted small metal-binding protein
MKEFSCGDVVPGCTARFRGNTDDEILSAVAQHARDEHGIESVSPDLADKVRSLIRDAA